MDTNYWKLHRAINEMQFFPNELALQGVSGKIELLVRDRLFYQLHCNYPEKLILKETPISQGRIDLTIDSTAVELKAYIENDMLRPFMINKIERAVREDFAKMRTAPEFSENFCILIIAITKNNIPSEFRNRIKYSTHTPSDGDAITEGVKNMFYDYEVSAKIIDGGSVYGVGIDIGIFLIG